MPPKRKRPIRRAPTLPPKNDYKRKINAIVDTLNKCHDDKIKSLVALIEKIFNTTDESHKISMTVTDTIKNLKPIPLTNKELSKSNLKTTNDLIERLKTINGSIQILQQTVGKEYDTPDGLTDSYRQVVEAIVKYAEKIKCPKKKSKYDFSEFAKMIDDLYFLEEKYREYYFLNYKQCISICEVPSLNGSTIQETSQYQNFLKLYRTKPYNDYNWLKKFKEFLTSYRHGDYNTRYFSSTVGGLISQLTILNSRLKGNKTPKQGGGSKHHKTKTTKKRIKGKQTRRNKVKTKTTIIAKNKTTIKAKNKTKKR
tara:strand:- start:2937 stop:3869 length:933 start_codon:yes stop_codon:yes gene_type:complete